MKATAPSNHCSHSKTELIWCSVEWNILSFFVIFKCNYCFGSNAVYFRHKVEKTKLGMGRKLVDDW